MRTFLDKPTCQRLPESQSRAVLVDFIAIARKGRVLEAVRQRHPEHGFPVRGLLLGFRKTGVLKRFASVEGLGFPK